MSPVGIYAERRCLAEEQVQRFQELKDNSTIAKSQMKSSLKNDNEQEFSQNAFSVEIKDLAWGRVMQRGKVSSVHDASISNQVGKEVTLRGDDTFKYAFVEKSTAEELSEKGRNADTRSVEERTFATGGKIIDFTV